MYNIKRKRTFHMGRSFAENLSAIRNDDHGDIYLLNNLFISTFISLSIYSMRRYFCRIINTTNKCHIGQLFNFVLKYTNITKLVFDYGRLFNPEDNSYFKTLSFFLFNKAC